MSFWSKKRLLFRLSVAAVLLLATRFLVVFTSFGTQVVPPLVGSEEGQTTSLAASKKSGTRISWFGLEKWVPNTKQAKGLGPDDAQTVIESTPVASSALSVEDVRRLQEKAAIYGQSIFDPTDTSVDRLACPQISHERYEHLQIPQDEYRRKYYFALDLRQVVDLLPRLLGSVVEAMRFLGPQNCALAIVEGNSADGTWEVLSALAPELENLGVRYFLRNEKLDPAGSDDRIGNLARLRSLALEPLRNSRNETARKLGLLGSTLDYMDDSVVIFLNDVAACTEDILELLHQRVVQDADMTCAMDWHHPGGRDSVPLFYDVWISRTLSGNLFFDIPLDGSWLRSETLFPFDPEARTRYAYQRPFQVFACWNGAVAFTARPILDATVDFRKVREHECFQGEPQLFCKDMWFAGYGKIAVVPSINLEYTDERGRWIKETRKYVTEWVQGENKTTGEMEGAPPVKIQWKGPPDTVKCMPSWDRQDWLAWNESLV